MKLTLQSYTKYNLWAHERVCDFLRIIPAEQFHTEIKSSFSSLHKTLFHVYGAQELWISRLHGHSPESFPASDSMSPADAMNALLNTSKQLISYLDHSTDESLMERVRYKNLAGAEFVSATWEILQHVVNHGTYHRGQIVTLLRQLGHETLFDSDYIVFTRLPVPA